MKEKIKSYIFIIIISIIISIPLFNEKFNIYNDDGVQHICRLMGTYQSIEEGQVFPVIMSNFCNEFGYSWNLFYSPLTAYAPLLFKLFTNSYVTILKLFMLGITCLSGISMYEFLYKVTKNKYAGLLGSVIYIFAPYRLTDMYIRVAVAELASFIFLPMVFHGIYNIFSKEDTDKEKSGLLLAFGGIGLILTHLVIAMYTAIIAGIYVLINIKKLTEKVVLKKLIINLILILTITSFFWAPMLEHKFATEYEVFKEGRMERTEVLIHYKLDILDLLYTKQGNMIFEIGLFTLIGVVLTFLAYKKIDKEYKMIYVFSLVTGILSIIMTLKYFPFEKLPSILKMLQFSFRMLEFSSFFLGIVAAINYSIVIKNFKLKDVVILTIIILLLSIPLANKFKNSEDIFDENMFWPSYPVTQYTGRVHAGCASFEYLPSKAFNNLDYIKTRDDKVHILKGNAQIEKQDKSGTRMEVILSNIEKDTILELPYIFYLGYNVTLESNDNISTLETYESDNGFIQIHLDEVNNGKLMITYTGTNIMKIFMVISIIGFTVMILYYCISKSHKNEIFGVK